MMTETKYRLTILDEEPEGDDHSDYRWAYNIANSYAHTPYSSKAAAKGVLTRIRKHTEKRGYPQLNVIIEECTVTWDDWHLSED